MPKPYHHGDLRAQVLDHAAVLIARDGPEAFSLRVVAAELGVSHTAPRHHFGSRVGVFTALAVQGYDWLGRDLGAASARGFAEVGVAYVDFALAHPGHFAVMHAPSLVDRADADLARASAAARRQLTDGVGAFVHGTRADVAVAAVAAWSMVHGLATLALAGALAPDLTEAAGGDLHDLVLRSARLLFTTADPTDPEVSR